jgi:hypothetical protein
MSGDDHSDLLAVYDWLYSLIRYFPNAVSEAVNLISSKAGSVLFIGADEQITEDNAHLFYDDINNRLGIGTNTPENVLVASTDNQFEQFFDIINKNNGPYAGASFRAINDLGNSVYIGIYSSGRVTPPPFAPNSPYLYTATENMIIMVNNASGNLKFAAGGLTEQMRLEGSSGYLGINTTDPTAFLDVNGDIIRVRIAKTPATSSATGNTGDIAWDSTYLYICIATNTWHRILHATW